MVSSLFSAQSMRNTPELPYELVHVVLSKVDEKTLKQSSRVCHVWNIIANDIYYKKLHQFALDILFHLSIPKLENLLIEQQNDSSKAWKPIQSEIFTFLKTQKNHRESLSKYSTLFDFFNSIIKRITILKKLENIDNLKNYNRIYEVKNIASALIEDGYFEEALNVVCSLDLQLSERFDCICYLIGDVSDQDQLNQLLIRCNKFNYSYIYEDLLREKIANRQAYCGYIQDAMITVARIFDRNTKTWCLYNVGSQLGDINQVEAFLGMVQTLQNSKLKTRALKGLVERLLDWGEFEKAIGLIDTTTPTHASFLSLWSCIPRIPHIKHFNIVIDMFNALLQKSKEKKITMSREYCIYSICHALVNFKEINQAFHFFINFHTSKFTVREYFIILQLLAKHVNELTQIEKIYELFLIRQNETTSEFSEEEFERLKNEFLHKVIIKLVRAGRFDKGIELMSKSSEKYEKDFKLELLGDYIIPILDNMEHLETICKIIVEQDLHKSYDTLYSKLALRYAELVGNHESLDELRFIDKYSLSTFDKNINFNLTTFNMMDQFRTEIEDKLLFDYPNQKKSIAYIDLLLQRNLFERAIEFISKITQFNIRYMALNHMINKLSCKETISILKTNPHFCDEILLRKLIKRVNAGDIEFALSQMSLIKNDYSRSQVLIVIAKRSTNLIFLERVFNLVETLVDENNVKNVHCQVIKSCMVLGYIDDAIRFACRMEQYYVGLILIIKKLGSMDHLPKINQLVMSIQNDNEREWILRSIAEKYCHFEQIDIATEIAFREIKQDRIKAYILKIIIVQHTNMHQIEEAIDKLSLFKKLVEFDAFNNETKARCVISKRLADAGQYERAKEMVYSIHGLNSVRRGNYYRKHMWSALKYIQNLNSGEVKG